MKKMLAIILTFTLIAICFVGCNYNHSSYSRKYIKVYHDELSEKELKDLVMKIRESEDSGLIIKAKDDALVIKNEFNDYFSRDTLDTIYLEYIKENNIEAFYKFVYKLVHFSREFAIMAHDHIYEDYGLDVLVVVESTINNEVVYSIDCDGNVLNSKKLDDIKFDYDKYEDIEGIWYEEDNYWVDSSYYDEFSEFFEE